MTETVTWWWWRGDDWALSSGAPDFQYEGVILVPYYFAVENFLISVMRTAFMRECWYS